MKFRHLLHAGNPFDARCLAHLRFSVGADEKVTVWQSIRAAEILFQLFTSKNGIVSSVTLKFAGAFR
jgi:hypothetical protein